MKEEETKQEEEIKKVVIYRESLIQSVIADFTSMLFLVITFWVNITYINSRILSVVLVLLFILKLIAWGQGKENVFTDKKSAIDYINS